MPTITLELPVAGAGITAGLHAANYADIEALLNGLLDGANIAATTVLTITSATLTGVAGLVLSGAGGKDTLNLSNTAADTGITIGADTNLYRSAANVLKTDDNFYAAFDLLAQDGLSAQVRIGNVGAGNVPAIVFGTLADTNLYRLSANNLQTDDNFFVGSTSLIGLYATGVVQIAQTDGNGYIEFFEQSPIPGASPDNRARVFLQDNGAGKEQLAVRFATGAVQVLATEP